MQWIKSLVSSFIYFSVTKVVAILAPLTLPWQIDLQIGPAHLPYLFAPRPYQTTKHETTAHKASELNIKH